MFIHPRYQEKLACPSQIVIHQSHKNRCHKLYRCRQISRTMSRTYDEHVRKPKHQSIELTDLTHRLELLADNNNSRATRSSFDTSTGHPSKNKHGTPDHRSDRRSWQDSPSDRLQQPYDSPVQQLPRYSKRPTSMSRDSSNADSSKRTIPPAHCQDIKQRTSTYNTTASPGQEYHVVSSGQIREESEARRCSGARSPRPWFALSCFLATLTFSFSVNTDFLPQSVTPALGSILPAEYIRVELEDNRVILIIAFWGAHFLRRFFEILFVHIYQRDVTLAEAVLFNVHYAAFGFWIGWSVNYYNAFWVPNNYFFVPGIFIFVTGEIGNCVSHVQLRRMRTGKNPVDSHDIPRGGLFRHVACPHYVFEMLTWLGFTLTTFTMATVIFCALNIISLVVYAVLRKRSYREVGP